MATIDIANGVRNLEEIASTPGLDCEYVGPVDLSLGTQDGGVLLALNREEEEMISIIRRIADVCQANGIMAGIHCGTIQSSQSSRTVERPPVGLHPHEFSDAEHLERPSSYAFAEGDEPGRRRLVPLALNPMRVNRDVRVNHHPDRSITS